MNINVAINYLNQAKTHLHGLNNFKKNIDELTESLKKYKIQLEQLEKIEKQNKNFDFTNNNKINISNTVNPKLTVKLIDEMIDNNL